MSGITAYMAGSAPIQVQAFLNNTALSSSGKPTSWTSPAVTCTVLHNYGTPSFTWHVDNVNYAWNVASGQGTATATASVSGVVSDTALANFYCVVTVDGQTVTSPICSLTYTNTL